MIGPIFRAPHREPRSTVKPTSLRRRTKNLVTDLFEYAMAPLARWERQVLVTERIEIAVRGLGAEFDGYIIAFLSDLHVSPLVPTWWLERAVNAALALKPDLIALGGDFLDDDPHYIPLLSDILWPLRAPDGVYGVLGNHDHYVGAQAVREQVSRGGVKELYNESLMIRRGKSRLAIAGVGDLERDTIDFTLALGDVPDAVPRIVLSHDPDVFAYWPLEQRMDLMLSGHTHGGQAWLPVIGPPFVPSQFGARFLRGLIREGDRQLYVTRGIGVSGAPFRWRCPPELSHIILRRDLTTSA
jgi:predicted MPP superfamily phosphohydrolase